MELLKHNRWIFSFFFWLPLHVNLVPRAKFSSRTKPNFQCLPSGLNRQSHRFLGNQDDTFQIVLLQLTSEFIKIQLSAQRTTELKPANREIFQEREKGCIVTNSIPNIFFRDCGETSPMFDLIYHFQ
jgi:hypothetical protein